MKLTDADIERIAQRVAALLRDHPAPRSSEPPADIGHELRELRRQVARIEGVLLRTVLRAESRSQQARKAGVSRSTLWRREKRERLRQMAEGRI